MESNVFFKFEIIMIVFASSFRFIWIPMLWVYNQYKYFYYFSAGSSLYIRIWRLQSQIPTYKDGLHAVKD